MTSEQKKKLERKLWDIANELRGKMSADEFRDYILGFIFFKYLSEKMHIYANNILSEDGISYRDIDETSGDGPAYLEAVKAEALDELGYFLRPSELFLTCTCAWLVARQCGHGLVGVRSHLGS